MLPVCHDLTWPFLDTTFGNVPVRCPALGTASSGAKPRSGRPGRRATSAPTIDCYLPWWPPRVLGAPMV
jgi:hypothetical protein